MILVVQRVSEASVAISGKIRETIGCGLLILLGIGEGDGADDVSWLAKKAADLRIFSDKEGKMNLSLREKGGEVLVISQFTLHASTKKGNRPSFIRAARPELAIPLYQSFIENLSNLLGKPVYSGEFGADMKVGLINDGPVTIIMDSKNRI